MTPMIKLNNQLQQVVMATPLARRLEAWTSAGRAQGTGDHPRPKEKQKMRMKETPTQASFWWFGQSCENLAVKLGSSANSLLCACTRRDNAYRS